MYVLVLILTLLADPSQPADRTVFSNHGVPVTFDTVEECRLTSTIDDIQLKAAQYAASVAERVGPLTYATTCEPVDAPEDDTSAQPEADPDEPELPVAVDLGQLLREMNRQGGMAQVACKLDPESCHAVQKDR